MGIKNWLTSGLLRKILAALLIVSLGPFIALAYFTLESYQQTRDDVVGQSRQALDSKAFEDLEARTVLLAEAVATFLRERESDLDTIASLPRTEAAYLGFASAKHSQIWTVVGQGDEVYIQLALFREIAFIDASGMEVIKVSNQCEQYPFTCQVVVVQDLLDVSDPQNTLYMNEDYFAESMALEEGGTYVGSPIGSYVPYERAYAGAQNRSGERFRGVLRFAKPIFEDGQRVGVVVAAVEMLHILEISAHIAPASTVPLAEIDARQADYAYLVDPRGWAISHPRHFNISGVDENGQPVQPIREEDRGDPNNLYRPGNLSLMGFIDPGFPKLVAYNQAGGYGTITMRPWGERDRALGYAGIPYYTGRYDTPAGFGMVILTTDGARFHLEAGLLGKQIDNRIADLNMQQRLVMAAALLVVFVLAILLARNVAAPILRLTSAAQRIEVGDWEGARIEDLAQATGRDEVARLRRVFASMAEQVHEREARLRKQVHELQIVVDEVKRAAAVAEITETEFFYDLTSKADSMRRRRKGRSADENLLSSEEQDTRSDQQE